MSKVTEFIQTGSYYIFMYTYILPTISASKIILLNRSRARHSSIALLHFTSQDVALLNFTVST